MSEWLKLLLALGAAAVGLTLAAMALTWLMNEPRRLGRVFRQELGARPDASLIATGTGRGVALSLAARRFVTGWDRGAWRMVYPLEDLIGAELELDGHVAARALRDEPRRRLERQSGAETDVRLRFLFDDPRPSRLRARRCGRTRRCAAASRGRARRSPRPTAGWPGSRRCSAAPARPPRSPARPAVIGR